LEEILTHNLFGIEVGLKLLFICSLESVIYCVVQQRNVSHSTVGIVASGFAMPGSDIGSQF